jgi:hypothetical protein
VRGAPIAPDDVEDGYFVLLSALGVAAAEAEGDLSDDGGKKVLGVQLGRLFRSQGRRVFQNIVRRAAGRQVARKATERTLVRVLAPGVSIPISAGMNWRFTSKVLRVADLAMRRRAAVLGPLLRAFDAAPDLSRDAVFAAVAEVCDAPGRNCPHARAERGIGHTHEWAPAQKDALRASRHALAAREDAAETAPAGALPARAGRAVVDYLTHVAALAETTRHDDDYARALASIAERLGAPFDAAALAAARAALS